MLVDDTDRHDKEIDMATAQKAAEPRTSTTADGFTDDERAAMKERARELRAARKGSASDKAAQDAADVLAKIAELPETERAMAERLHAVVLASAPSLSPKTWYGMPAYAKDGKIVCFFQSAAKFKSRYATLGFNDPANLDDGAMWPTAFAITELTPEVEEQVADLVKQAVS